MTITPERNKSLKALNTFGFDRSAELFLQVGSDSELEQAVRYAKKHGIPLFVLGGGSNIVLVDDIPGLVIQLNEQSIAVDHQSSSEALVQVSAGVNWHSLVQHTLKAQLPGLENLSLIPGSTGAAPVQNIGAYGLEVRDRIVSVKALHVPTLCWHELNTEQCRFSYRNSYFKENADAYIISEVTFSLGTRHGVRYDYATLQQHLQKRDIDQPTAQQISESVIAIRRARLPDPASLGNAGSFFHNPVVSAAHCAKLRDAYPQLVSYPQADGRFKLAAGWLIDNLGFKGMKRRGVGVHDEQALVLVNHGSGSGTDILALASEITSAVHDAYGVTLAIEPQILARQQPT